MQRMYTTVTMKRESVRLGTFPIRCSAREAVASVRDAASLTSRAPSPSRKSHAAVDEYTSKMLQVIYVGLSQCNMCCYPAVSTHQHVSACRSGRHLLRADEHSFFSLQTMQDVWK